MKEAKRKVNMSFTLYDEALTLKIRKWVLDPNVIVMSPEETRRVFEWKADTTDDRPIQLPLITLSREPDAEIRINAKRAMTYRGKVFNNQNGISDHLNAVPVNLSYTLNIYTRYLSEADEYVRNFVFNLINYPDILIEIPYNNSEKAYTSYITLQPTITDNSDVPERLIPGQFSRLTLSLALNDAQLFSYNHKKVPHVVGVNIETKLVKDESSTDTETVFTLDDIKITV